MPAHSKRTPEMVEAILDGRAEIYGLYDPRDGALRYIGKANNSAKRLASHKRDARKRDAPVHRWIRKLETLGMSPTQKVLSVTDDWEAEERRLIALHRTDGSRLLNVADGGDQPFCDDATRSKNGRLMNERIAADPQFAKILGMKRQMGQALKRGEVGNNARAKLREAARLRPDWFGLWLNLPDREEA